MASLPPFRRLKIAAVTWFYDDQPGYLVSSYRINALAERHDVTVISRRPIDAPEFKAGSFKNLVFPHPTADLKALLSYHWQVHRSLRAEGFDLVVHIGSHTSLLANFSYGCQQAIYWNEHPTHILADTGSLPRRLLKTVMRALQFRGAARAALVMPIGGALLDDLLTHRPRGRVELVPMGVGDCFEVSPSPSESGVLRLVYTGTVAPERGRDVMLGAMARLQDRGFRRAHLTIVGASPEQFTYLNNKIRELSLAAFVSVHPRLPGSEIPNFLSKADFGICLWEDRPYWRFNPPTKLFEYLLAGLPVLASNIRTHSDYIQDGENGFIFEYDSDSLAETIVRATTSLSNLEILRRKARESGKANLWSSVQPIFLQHVESVATTKEKP